MNESPKTICDDILATLSMVYQETTNQHNGVEAEEELKEGDLDEAVDE